MKVERIVLLLVLVAIIFVATIAMFIYKTFTPSPDSQRNNDLLTEPLKVSTTTSNTSSTDSTPTGSLPEADSHTALDDCIVLKAAEARGKNYERGSLLVTFFDLVSYELAIESIKFFGLKADDSAETKSRFTQDHWIKILVPSGEEFKWQCTLEASDVVRRASLNLMFSLRQ